MIQSRNAVFLTFVRILVDETTEEEPLTKMQIIERMKEEGCDIGRHTFGDFIRNMAEAGIIIKRRQPQGKHRCAYLYWYADGWI